MSNLIDGLEKSLHDLKGNRASALEQLTKLENLIKIVGDTISQIRSNELKEQTKTDNPVPTNM